MIRSLRRRFVCVVMESFLLVVILVLACVNLVNRANVYAGLDTRLSYLAESSMGPPIGMVASTPEHIRGWVDLNSSGIMNEASYFIFSGTMAGSMLQHQLDVLSAATGLDAETLIADILAGSQTKGTIEQYRYLVVTRQTPYRIVFLNCEAEFSAMRSLRNTSALVGLVSVILALLLVLLLSGTAIRPFEQNIQNQRRFISNASHELKTPLGVIMADLDMQILESGETEWLRNAQEQTDHLSTLIEQLTAYSLLREKKSDAELQQVDVSALAEGILADFRPGAMARDLHLTADIQPDISISGSEGSMHTLLSVLMDNAVKYTPAGGDVHLSVRQEKKLVIELTNTLHSGTELDPSQLFDRFYRAPEHRASPHGHGLGLSIAQEITDMNGGSIRARCGDGTVTFTVEI